MKLSRRSFLKIGAAGIMVVATPPIILAAITARVTRFKPHIWTPRVGKGKYIVSAVVYEKAGAEGKYHSLEFEAEGPTNLYIELDKMKTKEAFISNIQLERVGRRMTRRGLVHTDAKTGVVIARYRG